MDKEENNTDSEEPIAKDKGDQEDATPEEENEESVTRLQTKLNDANKYKNELLGKLRKINLTKLSAEEPAVWERKINNASKKVLESFESITAYPSSK